jgi:TolA-binding protein
VNPIVKRPTTVPAILTAAAACVCAAAAPLRADTVWISSSGGGGTNAIMLSNVKVTGIADGKLTYQFPAGNSCAREIAQDARMQIDDEPLLGQAEEAAAAGRWDVATDALLKELSTTGKEWLKPWIGRRLVVAAQQANRFDAAATGYIALLLADPAHAADVRPALPDGRSSYLVTALAQVAQALRTPNLAPSARQALLSFQLDLQRARGDQQAASATMQRMLQAGAQGGNDPAAAAQLARIKLQQAAMQLDKGDFAGATQTIRSNSKIFLEPRDQAQALYYLAEAQALAAAAATQNDAAAWQDAALAYMRVVAHFKDAPDAPFVPLSLLKTAQIEEKLNDPAAARTLYEQVVAQYPQDPAAATARAATAHLQQAH